MSNSFSMSQWNLNVASLIGPDMQGTRHAAVVDHRKCLVTPQIRSNKVPEGFMVFAF